MFKNFHKGLSGVCRSILLSKRSLLSITLVFLMLVNFLAPISLAATSIEDIEVETFASGNVQRIGTSSADPLDEGYTYDVYLKQVGAEVDTIRNSSTAWSLYADFDCDNELFGTVALCDASRNSKFANAGKNTFEEKSSLITLDEGVVLSNSAEHLLLFAYHQQNETIFFIVVEWEKGAAVDKTILDDAISSAPTDGYYTADDRYNGNITSSNGFWSDFQTALTKANAVNSDASVTQSEVDNTKAELQAAIDNLIPTTQVNATELYELISGYTRTETGYRKSNGATLEKENYSAGRWQEFETAVSSAQALLEALYNADGSASERNWGPAREGEQPEDAITNDMLADAAAAVLTAENGLVNNSDLAVADTSRELMEKLDKLFPMTEQGSYTDESWTAFTAARDTTKTMRETYSDSAQFPDSDTVGLFIKAQRDYYTACYGLTESGDITVNVTVCDNMGVKYPEYALTDSGTAVFSGAVTLSGGAHSVKDLCSSFNWSSDLPDIGANGVKSIKLVLVNGVILTSTENSYGTASAENTAIQLRDGDEVTILRVLAPVGSYYGWDTDVPITDFHEFLTIQQFTTDTSALNLAEGDSFTLNLVSADAYLNDYTGTWQAAAGKEIIVYGPRAEDSTYPAATATGIYTDSSGSADIALYAAGDYVITAVDTGDMAKGSKYPNLGGGAQIRVTVSSADSATMEATRADYLRQANELLDACDKDAMGDRYAEVQTAYDTAVSIMNSAVTMQQLKDALDALKTTVTAVQSETSAENTKNLSNFRSYLNKLPDDTSLLSQSVQSTVDALISCYAAMSDYQKAQLTDVELAKYNAIAAANEEGLPEAKSYSLTLNVKGDTDEATAALNAMVDYLRENTAKQDTSPSGYGGGSLVQSFVFQSGSQTVTSAEPLDRVRISLDVDYAAYFHVRDAADHTISGGGWSIKDENLSFVSASYLNYDVVGDLSVTINGTPYEVKSITFDGLDAADVAAGYYAPLDYSTYKGKDAEWPNLRFDGSYNEFAMPYGDVSVTVVWGPVNAGTELTEIYRGYDKSEYTAENWAALTKAYQDGMTAIANAADREAALAALDSAKEAMAAVAKRETGNLGTVSVLVENTTYSKAADGFRGTIAQGSVTLTEDTTMMTAILDVLEDNGFSWTTNGNIAAGKDITYIAGIFKDTDGNGYWSRNSESGLAEKQDGYGQSGWMGTLNDWFTNEGFSSFSVANGKLKDGDIIQVMFTLEGLGEDLGTSWENMDTSLKSLTAESGTLAPAFESGTLKYILNIGDASSTALQPIAVNKNFQVRTYLNETSGDNWYRRGESIPVQAGDIIHIGIGDKTWPGPTNTDGSAMNYTATWYTVYVTNSESAAATDELIAVLPAASRITYENYKTYTDAIGLANTANSISPAASETNREKLAALNEKVQKFEEIDAFKAALAELPAAENLQASDKDAVAALQESYESMNVDQIGYLTGAEKTKYNALVEWLAQQSTPENNAPSLKSGISASGNTAETAVNTAWTIDLTTIFEDADNDSLTYQVKVGSEEFASAEPNYSYTPSAEGETVLVFKANDGKADSETYTVTLKAVKKAEEPERDYKEVLDTVLAYIRDTMTTNPTYNTNNGEWSVFAVNRGGAATAEWNEKYIQNLSQMVDLIYENGDTLGSTGKYTEYARVVLALSSMGMDASKFKTDKGTYDFVTPLLDTETVSSQGNNGTEFALLALDCRNYLDTAAGNAARAALIKSLKDNQLSSGAWSISGGSADIDTTAAAVYTLAPYYLNADKLNKLGGSVTYDELKAMVNNALDYLSSIQSTNGGFGSAEADGWVVIALSSLGRDADTDSAFVKTNGSVLDDLLRYYDETTGGFKHSLTGDANNMATDQAAYSLVAYDRFKNNRNTLYDMTDAVAPVVKYSITVENVKNGTVSVSMSEAEQGDIVSVTAVADDGYELSEIRVNGTAITGTSFEMPAEDVTVSAVFSKIPVDPSLENRQAVDAAKAVISSVESWTVSMETANDSAAVKTWIESKLEELELSGVTASVTVNTCIGASAGTAVDKAGADGSFTFAVALSKGSGEANASDSLTGLTGTIKATRYVSSDVSVKLVSVDGTVGAIRGKEIQVVLPYEAGKQVPENPTFVIETTDADAKYSTPVVKTEGDYTVWNFTVTAENGDTETYSVYVSVAENPAAGNIADVAAAKTAIENADYVFSGESVNTQSDVKAALETRINGLIAGTGVTAVVTIDSFTPAEDGTASNLNGTNGSFRFTVKLSKGENETLAEDTAIAGGSITAAVYVLSNDAGVKSITVAGRSAEALSAYAYAVEVPYGTAITKDSFTIELSDTEHARITSDPANNDNVWSFTVTAEDATAVTYTVAVSFSAENLTFESGTRKGANTVSVSGSISDQAAAQAVADSVAVGSAIQVNVGAATAESEKSAALTALLAKGMLDGREQTVTLTRETYLDIAVTAFSSRKITLVIEPKYDLYASVEGADPLLVSEKNNASVSGNVTISVTLPDGFAAANTAYVRHIKDNGRVYYYTASMSGNVATFTVTNGFSTFEITPNNQEAAEAVSAAAAVIRRADFSTTQKEAGSASEAKTAAEKIISHLKLSGVNTSVQITDFTAATAGTSENPEGTNGRYEARITIWSGDETENIVVNGTITATKYNSGSGSDSIRVTFRLIGAELAKQDVNLASSNYLPEYVTWIPTTAYTVTSGDTVYDVTVRALRDAGIRQIGADNNYIATIYAPEVLGGYALSEFTNGKYSGWMYTVNGKHPDVGLQDCTLKNGDVIIWHYVNDYRYEVSDWYGGSDGNASTWDGWLNAPDKAPEAPSENTDVNSVIALINAIGKVDMDSKDDIDAARNAYDKLFDSQKKLVSNYQTLVDAEKAYQKLKDEIDDVIDLIDAIGTVTKTSGSRITAARSAYNALTEQQKKLVTNFKVLTAAEAAYARLTGTSVFSDVKQSDYFYDAVLWAVENGITNGTTDTTFSPDSSCTRAQMVTFLWRAAGSPEPSSRICRFTDVDENEYYFEALLWAIENGITNGTSATTFSPNAVCTRGQMAAFLYRYAKSPTVKGRNPFADVTSSDYFYDAVIWAAEEGITKGTSASAFSPKSNCTRGQMVTFLYRYLG